MAKEESRILEALRLAINMEIEGREYYLKASEASSDEAGRALLRSLALQEEIHRRKCEEIFGVIRREHRWLKIDLELGRTPEVKIVFSGAGAVLKPSKSELEAVEIAIDMENTSYDFYRKQQSLAISEAERGFYEALAAEEMKHKLALLDYQEYLKNPAAWFMRKERPSLNGGLTSS